jgi:RNA polymerase sigma-70 factor (ECF subfamily)
MSRGDAPQTTEDEDASKSVERDERVRQVTHAVRRLKDKYREVVVLHYLQEMSIDDVAKVLGLSRGAVEMRLHRGRQMLQEILAPTIEHESP